MNMGSFTNVSSVYHGGRGKIIFRKRRLFCCSTTVGHWDELMVTSCSVSTSVNISMVQNRRSYLLISSRVVLVGYLARGKPLISALGGQPHDILFKLK